MLFIIACAIEVILCILSMVIPTVYTYNWQYGSIKGVGSVHDKGDMHSFTLMNMYGWAYILIIVIVLIVAILYLVLFLMKKGDSLPKFVLTIVFLFPIIMMVAAKVMLYQSGNYIKSDIASYGSGVASGYTGFGIFMLIAFIGTQILISVALAINKAKINANPEKSVKTIEVKTPKKKHSQNTAANKANTTSTPKAKKDNVNMDDWKL